MAEKLREPDLTIDQLFDRNHHLIFMGVNQSWRRIERWRDTVWGTLGKGVYLAF